LIKAIIASLSASCVAKDATCGTKGASCEAVETFVVVMQIDLRIEILKKNKVFFQDFQSHQEKSLFLKPLHPNHKNPFVQHKGCIRSPIFNVGMVENQQITFG
jgi:hypothetical protein